MKRFLLTIVASLPLFASTTLFPSYESARQALMTQNVPKIQSAAATLAKDARAVKQNAVAAKAEALAKATSFPAAKSAFGALSDEMIRYRSAVNAKDPIVVYCSMEKKSWLQPKGAVVNPYVDASMRGCGDVK
jgi:alanine racemase